MHVLFITADRQFLDETGERRALLKMMMEAADVLHVVVFTRRHEGYALQKLDDHTWLYPTNSLHPVFYFFDALRVIRQQLLWQGQLRSHIVVSDDPFLAGWLGTYVARRHARVWMLNIHTYFWERYSSYFTFSTRITLIPLSYVLRYAFRILVFSKRIQIYLEAAARTPEQKEKIFPFPAVYDSDTKNIPATIDIKQKYLEFNFILITAARGRHLKEALDVILTLRPRYRKAGLIVLDQSKSGKLQARLMGAQDMVRFEQHFDDVISYFKTANAFLYLGSGEEEDEMLIRAAAASCPIVASATTIARGIIVDGQNGTLVEDATADKLVAAIAHFNETMGVREQFRINSGMYLHEQFVENREFLVKKLREYWSFQEAPEDIPDPLPAQQALLAQAALPRTSIISRLMRPLQEKINYFLGK